MSSGLVLCVIFRYENIPYCTVPYLTTGTLLTTDTFTTYQTGMSMPGCSVEFSVPAPVLFIFKQVPVFYLTTLLTRDTFTTGTSMPGCSIDVTVPIPFHLSFKQVFLLLSSFGCYLIACLKFSIVCVKTDLPRYWTAYQRATFNWRRSETFPARWTVSTSGSARSSSIKRTFPKECQPKIIKFSTYPRLQF